jgi:hypothetical protein
MVSASVFDATQGQNRLTGYLQNCEYYPKLAGAKMILERVLKEIFGVPENELREITDAIREKYGERSVLNGCNDETNSQ